MVAGMRKTGVLLNLDLSCFVLRHRVSGGQLCSCARKHRQHQRSSRSGAASAAFLSLRIALCITLHCELNSLPLPLQVHWKGSLWSRPMPQTSSEDAADVVWSPRMSWTVSSLWVSLQSFGVWHGQPDCVCTVKSVCGQFWHKMLENASFYL